jgi:hypothetical protein
VRAKIFRATRLSDDLVAACNLHTAVRLQHSCSAYCIGCTRRGGEGGAEPRVVITDKLTSYPPRDVVQGADLLMGWRRRCVRCSRRSGTGSTPGTVSRTWR